MAGSIKGIIVEIGGDTSGLQKALSKVNSATSSLSKELKGINSLLKLDPKNTELLAQKQQVLNKNIETTEEKLKQLQEIKAKADEAMAKGTKINEENYRSLQREIITTQNKLSDLKNEASNWTKAGDALIKFGENLNKISAKIDSLGNKLTTRLTIPIAGALTSATKEAIEFESAFTGVTKTVDGTEEQLEKLKKEIKNLAKNIPSTTTEISSVAEAAGQLGISIDDILDFTKVMIDLGNSTNLSADEAASALAKFANITKMSSENYSKLGSTIVDLGNNFATTEADIVSMATRLAATGDLAGLSQSEILSLATAMSSVGIEAEAGGSAMSKLLKKIQVATETGGKDLKNFAKISGMTASDFKKYFQKDAVGALSKFISGLNNTERNGKSAIAILDDMGLTEVRLSNTILSLANSGDLMNKAVELGNKSWEENNALTNEANKRYKTTESQLKITKNQIKDVATSLGDKLLPTIKKILDKADQWISKFDELSDSEQENIIKIGLMVAAAGPLLKIGSSAIEITGNVSKGIGTFTKAIALAHNGIGTATGSASTLATVLQSLTSPVGLAIAGLTALGGIMVVVHEDSKRLRNISKELRNEIDEQRKSWENVKKASQEYVDNNSAEILSLQDLQSELEKVVDKNGKVKEGYEERAKYITGKLSEAIGKEIEINDGVIASYDEIREAINKTIATKEAEILLEGYQQQYNEALAKRGKATDTLIKLQQELNNLEEKGYGSLKDYAGDVQLYSAAIEKHNDKVKNYKEAIKEQEGIIKEYGDTIINYTDLQAAATTGSIDKIKTAINDFNISLNRSEDEAAKTYAEQIKDQKEYNNMLEELLQKSIDSNDEASKTIYENQKEINKQKLEELIKSFTEETKTVKTLGEDEIEAFRIIGEESIEEYNKYIKLMSPTVQEQLKEITNELNGNNSVEDSTKELAESIKKTFEKNTDAATWGKDLTQQVSSGMTNSSSKSSITSAAKKVAGWIKDFLGFSLPDKGPLSDFDTSMPDMIDLMVKGINSNKIKLEKSIEDMAMQINSEIHSLDAFQGKINSTVIDSTKTIFTTPQIVFNVQEMNEENLEQCFNYVNRKFGSAY